MNRQKQYPHRWRPEKSPDLSTRMGRDSKGYSNIRCCGQIDRAPTSGPAMQKPKRGARQTPAPGGSRKMPVSFLCHPALNQINKLANVLRSRHLPYPEADVELLFDCDNQ